MTTICNPTEGMIGFEFVMTLLECNGQPRNISSATEIKIRFRKPDASLLTVDAVLDSGGTDGKIKYVTQPGDFDQAGNWEATGYIVAPSGEGGSTIINFLVDPIVPAAA